METEQWKAILAKRWYYPKAKYQDLQVFYGSGMMRQIIIKQVPTRFLQLMDPRWEFFGIS